MRLPTICQYIDTIRSSFGLFKTIGEVEVERDTYNKVRLRSGNSAVVFKIFIDGQAHMLKCYIKAGRRLGQKYTYIAKLSEQCSFVRTARLLTDEIFVYDNNETGAFFDVVMAPWVEGTPLNMEIDWATKRNDKQRLSDLADKFDRLSLSILKQEWAHGDIKPENIIVDQHGELVMIDYDAIFIPELATEVTSEVGTQPYQHPLRDINMYDKHIDDYSIAIISVSLHALSLDPSLYEIYHKGDNIILDPPQIMNGNREVFNKIKDMFSEYGLVSEFRMAKLLVSSTPYLYELESILTEQVCIKRSTHTHSNLSPILHNGLWGYADAECTVVIDPVYEIAHSFSCGVAAVSLNGTWLFIDEHQQVMINCCQYNEVKPFSQNLASVRKDNLWGYIHIENGEVIEPMFQMASSFREDLAVVKHNDRYGYINAHGQWHIAPEFDHATNFKNGRAEIEKGGKIFYIDKSGNIL